MQCGESTLEERVPKEFVVTCPDPEEFEYFEALKAKWGFLEMEQGEMLIHKPRRVCALG